MSILIKGIKNPTDCWLCPLMSHMLCGYNKEKIPESGKREDCPLEEIPTPHGRLIDADEMIHDAERWIDHPDEYIRRRNKDLIYYLKTTPHCGSKIGTGEEYE